MENIFGKNLAELTELVLGLGLPKFRGKQLAEWLYKRSATDFQQMQKIHGELLKEIGDDPEAVELYEDLIDAATRYAGIRAKWPRMSKEEKMDTDPLRTSHHDSVITHLNMLARYLKM